LYRSGVSTGMHLRHTVI